MIIHNYSEIPDMELKRLDPSKSVSEIVEVFNFNMNQIYSWWKEKYYEKDLNGSEEPIVIHGINIVGEDGKVGEKGNSIYFVSETIQNGTIVPSDKGYKDGDYVISNNSIFSIEEGYNNLIYNLVGNLGGGVFTSPIEGVSIVSHAMVGWDTINNSTISAVSPYRRIGNDKIEYYSVHIGDYKKSNSLNSSLVITNILESKNDGSGSLPVDATAQTSRKFSQLTFQYRLGFNSEPFPNTATETFYRGSNGSDDNNTQYGFPFIHEIKNGASAVVLKNNTVMNRWMMSQDYIPTDSIDLSTSNVVFFREWNSRVMFYHTTDSENYFLHKETVTSTVPTLSIGFSTIFTAGVVVNNMVSSHTSDEGITRNVLVKDGVLQDPSIKIIKLPLIWNSINNNGWGDFPVHSNDKIKTVSIGSDRSYFIFGYASNYENQYPYNADGNMDGALWLMKKTYDKVKAQTGLFVMEKNFTYTDNVGWGQLVMQGRAHIAVNIEDTGNLIYGTRKTLYIKSFGYHVPTTGNGYFIHMPIKIFDVARGKTLKMKWGANISQSLRYEPMLIPNGQPSSKIYPTSYIYTNDERFSSHIDNQTMYLWGSGFTIMPRGANSGSASSTVGSDSLMNLQANSAIFKVELVFFGAGWEVESITPFSF